MKTTQMLAELRLPAQSNRLSLVRCCVREAAKLAGCHDTAVDNVVLAINEACMNVIQHGYGIESDQEMLLRICQEQDTLVVELLDHAPPVQADAVQPRALDEIRPGGLGVHFIRTIMDEMVFVQPPAGFGNLLRMVKRIEKGVDADGT